MEKLKAVAIRVAVFGISAMALAACVIDHGHIRPVHFH